ncbi:GNAT family N-acetyltransferase [Neobacillus mesonae]|nr:GNAT family N-acetyltransferase [Neobacillus mesonae]
MGGKSALPQTIEIAEFIAKLNADKQNHIGYVGTNSAEIEDYLVSEFSDLSLEESSVIILSQGEINAFLGFDVDLAAGEAEVWGPFIHENAREWQEMAADLWDGGIQQLQNRVHTFKWFYNTANQKGKEFVERLGAELRQKESIYVAQRGETLSELKNSRLASETNSKIETWNDRWVDAFSSLHEQCFPNTYYDAAEIIERINEENRLYLYKDEEELLGYIYTESSEQHAEGSIEYLAVAPAARKKGIGTALIKYAIADLFDKNIEEVRLCVSLSNEKAMDLYVKSGFSVEHELEFYVLHKR